MVTLVLEHPTDYDIFIRSVVKSWMGYVMSGMWFKRVSAEELVEIRRDPLQDFANFGVQDVIFVEIECYPIYRIDEYTVKRSTPEGDMISAWNKNCMHLKDEAEKVYEEMMMDYFENRIAPQHIR